MKYIYVILAVMIFFSSCMKKAPDNSTDVKHYGVFIGANTEKLLSLKNYDILVVDAEALTSENIDMLHKNGNTEIFSYLNIGSVEEFRSYYNEFLPYTIGEYENWEDEKWVDVSSKPWQDHISEATDKLIGKGIDGIFADNSDVFYVFPEPEIYDALISIYNSFSAKEINVIVNGGDMFISEALKNNNIPKCIKGVNQENVFTSIDFQNQTFGESSSEDRAYFFEYLDNCAVHGINVYLIEYGATGKLKKEINDYCRKNGFYCYYADSLNLD
ncbi:MAG: endo alpha-1,4 polygalactosaminidase [Oscillospiraceae bacterium]